MKKGFLFALLFVLLLSLGLGAGVLAARLSAPAPSPTPEASPSPEPTAAAPPTVLPEACGHPQFENGVCLLCDAACVHPFHGTDGYCLLCGGYVGHDFVDGRCACGAWRERRTELLPERFYEPCDQEGSIVTWSYETKMWGSELPVTVKADFYVPYGYDPAKQYNVLLLMHGLRTTQRSWLDEELSLSDGRSFEMRWVYDHMIREKLIEPLIIVSASQFLYSGDNQYKSSYEQMAAEIRNMILPYTASVLSTYAAAGDEQALIAAREHFAIGGNSWGSYYTYDTGMCQCLPYFASFLCFSGDAATGYVVQSLEERREYPIRLYYAAAGDRDVARTGEENCFHTIVPLVERLTEGENAICHICTGMHDWDTWSIEIYNALQLLFQE